MICKALTGGIGVDDVVGFLANHEANENHPFLGLCLAGPLSVSESDPVS